MMLHYEVSFNPNFQWALGGKLPGLRGGNLDVCSGEQLSFQSTVSAENWRESLYIYPMTNSLYSSNDGLCNDQEYGTSIERGSFSFVSTGWNSVDLIVQLNNPSGNANGIIRVYYNGLLAFNKTGLQIRSQDSITGFTGMFFSTFFGGNNASYESPADQHAYFRNFQMWASDAFSNGQSSSAFQSARIPSLFQVFAIITLLQMLLRL